jgi:hypothetical protein
MTPFFKKNLKLSFRFTLPMIVSLLLAMGFGTVAYAVDCDFCAKTGGFGCPPPPLPEHRPCPTCALP